MGNKCCYISPDNKMFDKEIIKRPDIVVPRKASKAMCSKETYDSQKNTKQTSENSELLSSERSEFDLQLLGIPKSRILEEIFIREGPFDFYVCQYPEGIQVENLDFIKAGESPMSKVYVSTDTEGRTTKYLGEWNGDMREGRGIQVTLNNPAEGDQPSSDIAFIYEGYWLNDLAHGKGRLIHQDGDVYKGSWEKGKASGYGDYIHSDGTKYEGSWKDDLQDGQGKEYWVDGSMYQGQYKQGCKHGQGKFIWSDSSVYQGEFNMNIIEGKGIYRWPDGRIYNGSWSNNKMDGIGTYKWPDGRVYEGLWHKSLQHGAGKYSEPNGEEIKTLYQFGKRVR
ncbi:unnamed protein product [Moneuplotes crassus]|uniref:MORN repeat protein n=2 Tax=Euplotes crassus TaxID=5936 RepID=A0AAD2CZD9_EUPCR|nr:unnamed protein product [Moneuplotes crassus]